MNKKNVFIISIVLIIAAAGLYLLVYKNAENQIPNLSPRGGEANSSSEFINAQHAVDYYRQKIYENPNETKNYVLLARIFIQESRITGRHHEYIPKAQQLIEDALNVNPNYFPAIVTKASLLMTLHQFNEAKITIEKAIAMNSYNADAYGVLVDANVELGYYDAAVKACDKMLSIRPDLHSYARASYLRELYGKQDAAITAMKMACDAGLFGRESRAWTLYNLGKLFLSEGNLDTASFIFNGILEERPYYAFALEGLAEVNCARKNYSKATEFLVKASQSNPNHIFIEKLADIYKVTGQKESEEEIIKQVLKSFEQHKNDGYDIHLEYARFCSNHEINLEEALEHARKEYERRPENIDALDAYAWALHKNGKSEEAIPYIEKAMRLDTKRSLMYFHAAAIYKSAGQSAKALENLRQSISYNSYVDVLYADKAQNMLASLERIVLAK